MASPATTARIGPNAIIQTVHAFRHTYGHTATAHLLHASPHPAVRALNQSLPAAMVPEDLFHALVAELEQQLGESATASILERAGQHTADYLLAHRIPKPFQWVVRQLPPRAALALLLAAIKQHAWTFAGSGSFTTRHILSRSIPQLTLTLPPMARPPVAAFYAGTLSRLFQSLISPTCRLATGAWRPPQSMTQPYVTCVYRVALMPARKESEPCVS